MKISFLAKKPQKKEIALLQLGAQKENFVFVSRYGEKIVSIGVPDREKINLRNFHLLARKIVSFCKQNRVKFLYLDFGDFKFPNLDLTPYDTGRILAENFVVANYEFIRYKTDKSGFILMKEIYVGDEVSKEARKGFADGLIIGQSVNGCRDLVNTPGGELTPKSLADHARAISRIYKKVKTTVLGQKKAQALGMGGLIGVSKGSHEEAQFVIMEYWGALNSAKPIVLVGKGVTFDSGGINIKPDDGLTDMHMDMAGAGAVLHTVEAAARLGLRKNIIALIPATENMPSGNSYRPGDVLKTLSGKTVEVMSTDAEGRLILADALTYAKKFRPKLVIDVATLTGAAHSALGSRASAIFTKDHDIEHDLMSSGELAGDYIWPLPLWEEFEEEVRGQFADLTNTAKTRRGGACTAAAFLWQFAKDYPWAHIDIAPRMLPADDEYLAKGATGAPVRMLVRLLENYK